MFYRQPLCVLKFQFLCTKMTCAFVPLVRKRRHEPQKPNAYKFISILKSWLLNCVRNFWNQFVATCFLRFWPGCNLCALATLVHKNWNLPHKKVVCKTIFYVNVLVFKFSTSQRKPLLSSCSQCFPLGLGEKDGPLYIASRRIVLLTFAMKFLRFFSEPISSKNFFNIGHTTLSYNLRQFS